MIYPLSQLAMRVIGQSQAAAHIRTVDDIPPSGLQPRRADASSWAAGWAQFSGGEAFTLGPEARTDGWVRRLRAIGGNDLFRLGGEFSAEERNDRAAPALRVSLQVGM